MRFLGLAFGQQLAGLRSSDNRVERILADAHSSAILAYVLREAVEILGARIDKLPVRQRPHFTPAQRFRILELVHLAGLTRAEAATLFRASVAIGSTLKPQPPIRRYGDPARHLVQVMARLGFHGYGTIADHFAHNGQAGRRGALHPSRLARGPHGDPRLPGDDLARRDTRQLLSTPGRSRRFPRAALGGGDDRAHRGGLSRHGRPRHIIVDQVDYFTALDFQERIKAWRVNLPAALGPRRRYA